MADLESSVIGRIKVGVAIMADPRRAEMVPGILDALDAPATVVWDEKQDRWDTGRRSMLAYRDADADTTHWLVIQDDAIVCKDLVAGLTGALEHVPADNPVGLYVGNVRPDQSVVVRHLQIALRDKRSWLVMQGPWWGVGICVPTRQIPPMIAWGDRHPEVENYDRRLSRYFAGEKLLCWYTLPSLVDHRVDHHSLVPGRQTRGRYAHWYIGDQSALDIDWSKTRPEPRPRPDLNLEEPVAKILKVMGPDGRTRTVTSKAFASIYAPRGYVEAGDDIALPPRPKPVETGPETPMTTPAEPEVKTRKPRTPKPRVDELTGAQADATA